MNPIRTIQSWVKAPGFGEVMAKSAFAAIVIAAIDFALRALA